MKPWKTVKEAAAKVVAPVVKEIERQSRRKPANLDPFYNDLARRREINERNRPDSTWIPRRPGWLAGHPRERW